MRNGDPMQGNIRCRSALSLKTYSSLHPDLTFKASANHELAQKVFFIDSNGEDNVVAVQLQKINFLIGHAVLVTF